MRKLQISKLKVQGRTEDLRRDAACTACPETGQLRILLEKLCGDGDCDLGRGAVADG